MVVGDLGTVVKELEKHLKTIGITIIISYMQKAALLRLRQALFVRTSLIFQRVGNSFSL